MTSRLEVLISAREKLAEGWTTGHLHDMSWGKHQYCAIGAIDASAPINKLARLSAKEALRETLMLDSTNEIMRWNDRNTQGNVLAGFDKAIAEERARKQKLTWLALRVDRHLTTQRLQLDTPSPVADLADQKENSENGRHMEEVARVGQAGQRVHGSESGERVPAGR